MKIPDGYLNLTLRQVLVLAGTHSKPGERIDVTAITAGVQALAKQLARSEAASSAGEREWLAQQFEALTMSAKPTGKRPKKKPRAAT